MKKKIKKEEKACSRKKKFLSENLFEISLERAHSKRSLRVFD